MLSKNTILEKFGLDGGAKPMYVCTVERDNLYH